MALSGDGLMILVRLMVRPHLLEKVFESLQPFELEAVTVRQVRGLKGDLSVRLMPDSWEPIDSSGLMHAEIDFFLDDLQSESLLETLQTKVACGSSDDCRIFCLHCAPCEAEPVSPTVQKLSY